MAQPTLKLGCKTLIDRLISSKWRLNRLFVSLKDGSTIGTASGFVEFSSFKDSKNNGFYLQYYEHGNMTYTSNAVSFPFKKHYLINIFNSNNEKDSTKLSMNWYFDIINEPSSNTKYSPKELSIETLFVDNNFFIGFELNDDDYTNHKEIKNIEPHLCDQDLYEGSIKFLENDSFFMQYHVNGPSKMYNIQTTFTKKQDDEYDEYDEQEK